MLKRINLQEDNPDYFPQAAQLDLTVSDRV